jgi:hypothetical protein
MASQDPFAAAAVAADVVVHGPGLSFDQAMLLNDCGERRPYKQLSKAGKALADSLAELGLVRIDVHKTGRIESGLSDVRAGPVREYHWVAVTPIGRTIAREYAKKGWYGKHLQSYPHKAATRRSNKKW